MHRRVVRGFINMTAIKNGILQNQTVHVRDAAAGGHVHLVLIQDMAQK